MRESVEEDLRRPLAGPLGGLPISVRSVSARTGISRITLRKYGLHEDIRRAAAQQAHIEKSELGRVRQDTAERIRDRDAENQRLKRDNENALRQLALIEGNAQRLAIDPSELYRPIETPQREVPYSLDRALRERHFKDPHYE